MMAGHQNPTRAHQNTRLPFLSDQSKKCERHIRLSERAFGDDSISGKETSVGTAVTALGHERPKRNVPR
jgi:hypothetical protein